MKKRIVGLFSFMLLFLVACGGGEAATGDEESSGNSEKKETEEQEEEKEAENELGDFNVELSGEVVEEGDKFVINGSSNLIPGSRLVAENWVSEDELFSDTTELVQDDGTFTMQLDHHQYGESEIIIKFDFDNVQDDPVKRHYGEEGQNLEGPFIYKHEVFGDVYKKAQAKVHFNPNEESDLTIKAPDWYDLPEDYGDPRIWIEVDEITEDGEFFYLHGRSNILEGAEIKGSFGNNRDTTQIKPDGSFDLKIEYKYIEDKDFVIEFDPLWQWNEIEEAYGSNGQKLVGDLVTTNQFSDKQYIEKIVEWEFD